MSARRPPVISTVAAAVLLAVGALGSGRAGSQVRVHAAAPPTPSQLLAKTTSCRQISHGRYKNDEHAAATVAVCGAAGAVFWRSDLDIDCDGVRTANCNLTSDASYQPATALEPGGRPLNAETTPYLVIPQRGPILDFGTQRIRLGAVAAVVYKGRLAYAVVGDVGPVAIIGEASYGAARLLGIDPDPSSGGVGAGVTYIVFANTRVADPRSRAAITKAGQAAAAGFLARN